jgi:poly(ADP-ribose) glycohydrolase ARH3
MASISPLSRFQGCLLGLAIGDALGGLFEAQSSETLRARFASPQQLFNYPDHELYYTDDTQMTIGVAETLVARGEIVEEELCRAFVRNYVPSRGYGRGARAILEAMEEGRDHRAVAEQYFPGGSYGNGAAMRVAPVGLAFAADRQRLLEQAKLSALPTHVHPLGIEGAQLLAVAVAHNLTAERFEREKYFEALLSSCTPVEFRDKLTAASHATSPPDLAALGNQIEALHSVPTAIASFALAPDSYIRAVGNVILIGGDTDTLAAMTGALAGAYLGREGLPPRLVGLLENGPQGRAFLEELGAKLWERCSVV